MIVSLLCIHTYINLVWLILSVLFCGSTLQVLFSQFYLVCFADLHKGFDLKFNYGYLFLNVNFESYVLKAGANDLPSTVIRIQKLTHEGKSMSPTG